MGVIHLDILDDYICCCQGTRNYHPHQNTSHWLLPCLYDDLCHTLDTPLTLNSTDALDRNFTAQIGNNAFSQVLRSGESITIVIPEYMTTDNTDGWYLQDTITGEWSVILVKEPY